MRILKIVSHLFVALSVQSQGFAEGYLVKMKSISFGPKVINIKVGDSVTWENISYTEHSATANDEQLFNTEMIQPKMKSKKVTFSKPGTFEYHCSVHGVTMSGSISVTQ
jgi:plastocyanin